MNYEIVNLNEKIIAGITARTGNSDPECQKIIGGLWQVLWVKAYGFHEKQSE